MCYYIFTYKEKNMSLEKVIEHFGSQSALANTLGITQGAVSQWVSDGSIPPARAIEIEVITKGEFKAVDLVQCDLI